MSIAIDDFQNVFSLLPSEFSVFAGIGGSGRQSSARVAAFIADFEVFNVNVTKSYSVNEWRSDLKKVLRRAGEDMVPTVFLFGDHQIKVITTLIHIYIAFYSNK